MTLSDGTSARKMSRASMKQWFDQIHPNTLLGIHSIVLADPPSDKMSFYLEFLELTNLNHSQEWSRQFIATCSRRVGHPKRYQKVRESTQMPETFRLWIYNKLPRIIERFPLFVEALRCTCTWWIMQRAIQIWPFWPSTPCRRPTARRKTWII